MEGKLLFTKFLLFLPSCNTLWGHLPPQPPDLIVWENVLHPCSSFLSLNLSCTGVSDSLMYVGFPYNESIKFNYFLLLIFPRVYLIIRQSRKTLRVEKSLFLSDTHLPGDSEAAKIWGVGGSGKEGPRQSPCVTTGSLVIWGHLDISCASWVPGWGAGEDEEEVC